MSKKILIVEDESLVAMDIKNILLKDGYNVCGIVNNGNSAIDAVRTHNPDLIMMDIRIKGKIDGIETAKRISNFSNSSVIYLTAFTDASTIDDAIDTSPEAYLNKPFKRSELLTSVKLALHKVQNKSTEKNAEEYISLGNDYYYLIEKQQILHHQTLIKLTRKETALFHLLFTNQGNIISFSEIENKIWYDKGVSDTSRRALIHRLRVKLEVINIETIYGIGCILHPPKL